jgi:hypothetical protein
LISPAPLRARRCRAVGSSANQYPWWTITAPPLSGITSVSIVGRPGLATYGEGMRWTSG